MPKSAYWMGVKLWIILSVALPTVALGGLAFRTLFLAFDGSALGIIAGIAATTALGWAGGKLCANLQMRFGR